MKCLILVYPYKQPPPILITSYNTFLETTCDICPSAVVNSLKTKSLPQRQHRQILLSDVNSNDSTGCEAPLLRDLPNGLEINAHARYPLLIYVYGGADNYQRYKENFIFISESSIYIARWFDIYLVFYLHIQTTSRLQMAHNKLEKFVSKLPCLKLWYCICVGWWKSNKTPKWWLSLSIVQKPRHCWNWGRTDKYKWMFE